MIWLYFLNKVWFVCSCICIKYCFSTTISGGFKYQPNNKTHGGLLLHLTSILEMVSNLNEGCYIFFSNCSASGWPSSVAVFILVMTMAAVK